MVSSGTAAGYCDCTRRVMCAEQRRCARCSIDRCASIRRRCSKFMGGGLGCLSTAFVLPVGHGEPMLDCICELSAPMCAPTDESRRLMPSRCAQQVCVSGWFKGRRAPCEPGDRLAGFMAG